LVVKVVELSRGRGKLGDPDMKEVLALKVVGRAIPPVCKRLIAVARARLPTEEVDSLDLWPYLPKSDPDLLEQVLDVIPSEARTGATRAATRARSGESSH
jgi:hypothetical protein